MIRPLPSLGLALAAVVLLAPSLIVGNLHSHSSPQNLTWAEQFADQFRAGVVYPRWLPDSFDNLGGPAFYFYPPIGFWLDAVLSVATFNVLSVSYRLSLASLLLLWASGIAMHAWLKGEATSSRAAFYGALAYMAAPYHLLDHYYRGAYAEFAAYAVLPLVALTVRQIADGKRFGPIFLAVAYAALPMAHLPTSLLISVTALPMYVLYRGWRLGAMKPALWFFLRCALGGLLGLGLAATYLIPALTLQDWIPAADFWVGDYHVEKWFLLTLGLRGQLADMMLVLAWCAAAYAIAAVGVLVVQALQGLSQGWRSEAAFWAFVCLVCLLFVAGIVPWFWKLPFVAKVQFPFRLMIVVEFAVITALCLAPWYNRSRAVSFVFIAAIIALIPSVAEMGSGIRLRVEVSLASPDLPADLKQFLPAGYPQKPDGGYAELSLGPVEGLPVISCSPTANVCRAEKERFGTMRLTVESATPTTVVLRRFFFPSWRIDGVAVSPTNPLRLVSFTAPAGRHVFQLRRTALPAEQWGWVLSGLSLVVLLLWAAAVRHPSGGQRTQ